MAALTGKAAILAAHGKVIGRQKRAFSAFGRLVRSMARIATCTKKADLSQYLPGFAELLDLDDG